MEKPAQIPVMKPNPQMGAKSAIKFFILEHLKSERINVTSGAEKNNPAVVSKVGGNTVAAMIMLLEFLSRLDGGFLQSLFKLLTFFSVHTYPSKSMVFYVAVL